MADDGVWKTCAIQRWTKLNHKCVVCGKEHADIEFQFSGRGLPKGYDKTGHFVRAWHLSCLPVELQRWQSDSEAAMIAIAQTPFGE